MMTIKVWKDECDECHQFKAGCHGYGEFIYCPDCAKEKGYSEWKKVVKGGNQMSEVAYEELPKEEITRSVPNQEKGEEEKTYENGNKAVTIKKTEEGTKANFFEDGKMVKTTVFKSYSGAFKAKKKWLG